MVTSYQQGDTSHAFSIAMKVLLAVETLHTDLDMPKVGPSTVHAVNCEASLATIISLAKSPLWL